MKRPILLALLALALGASPALAAPRPNDPNFSDQWAFGPAKKYGMDVLRAWDFSRGKGVVVAVVDSGFIGARYYPDFGARILPGYDFVSDVSDARDGDGRDGDPADPGDWCDEDGFRRSTWHGTKVASIIGATAGNRIVTAGVAPLASIVFVRVTGACGIGTVRDISDGILWAAGIAVPGTPLNEHPARIINLSMGLIDAPCSEQDAINQATLAGAIVVVSAGNNNRVTDTHAYTRCDNTIAVTATDGRGAKSPYSNYGQGVDIAAPVNGDDSCDDAAIVPYFKTEQWAVPYSKKSAICVSGTSFAAPLVSGALALAASYDPTTSSDDLITLLLDTVTPFPPITTPSNSCYSLIACGAGIVSAGKLLTAMSSRSIPSVLLDLDSEATLSVGAPLPLYFTVSNSSGEPIVNESATLSSLTPDTCSVGEWQVTALTIGDCNIRVSLNGTAQTAPRSFVFPFKHDRVSIVANIAYLPTMSSKAKQEITSRAFVDSWSLKSLTPKVCKVRYGKSIGYDLVGMKRGRCDLRAFFEASEGSKDEVVFFSIAVE